MNNTFTVKALGDSGKFTKGDVMVFTNGVTLYPKGNLRSMKYDSFKDLLRCNGEWEDLLELTNVNSDSEDLRVFLTDGIFVMLDNGAHGVVLNGVIHFASGAVRVLDFDEKLNYENGYVEHFGTPKDIMYSLQNVSNGAIPCNKIYERTPDAGVVDDTSSMVKEFTMPRNRGEVKIMLTNSAEEFSRYMSREFYEVTLEDGLNLVEGFGVKLYSNGLEGGEYMHHIRGRGICYEDNCMIGAYSEDALEVLLGLGWVNNHKFFITKEEVYTKINK